MRKSAGSELISAKVGAYPLPRLSSIRMFLYKIHSIHFDGIVEKISDRLRRSLNPYFCKSMVFQFFHLRNTIAQQMFRIRWSDWSHCTPNFMYFNVVRLTPFSSNRQSGSSSTENA